MSMTEDQIYEMADVAGSAARDVYETASEGGKSKLDAAAAAIEAAGQAMTDFGAPPEMVDTMRDSANKSFSEAFEDDADTSPVYWIMMALREITPQ